MFLDTKPIADGANVNPLVPFGSLGPLLPQNLKELPTTPTQQLKNPITAFTTVDTAAEKSRRSSSRDRYSSPKNRCSSPKKQYSLQKSTVAFLLIVRGFQCIFKTAPRQIVECPRNTILGSPGMPKKGLQRRGGGPRAPGTSFN